MEGKRRGEREQELTEEALLSQTTDQLNSIEIQEWRPTRRLVKQFPSSKKKKPIDIPEP